MRTISIVLVAALVAAFGVIPAPAQAIDSSISVEVCQEIDAGRGVGCGVAEPAGSPWDVTIVKHAAGAVPFTWEILDVGGAPTTCSSTRTRGPRVMWFVCTHYNLSSGLAPGTHTVRLVRPGSGDVIAETRFEVVAQTPEQALAVYRGASLHDRFGRALALFRLGRTEEALRVIDAMRSSPDPGASERALRFLVVADGKINRPHDAREAARELLAFDAGQRYTPAFDYVIAARAYWRACDAAGARRTLIDGLRAWSSEPTLIRLATTISQPAPGCPAAGGEAAP